MKQDLIVARLYSALELKTGAAFYKLIYDLMDELREEVKLEVQNEGLGKES